MALVKEQDEYDNRNRFVTASELALYMTAAKPQIWSFACYPTFLVTLVSTLVHEAFLSVTKMYLQARFDLFV